MKPKRSCDQSRVACIDQRDDKSLSREAYRPVQRRSSGDERSTEQRPEIGERAREREAEARRGAECKTVERLAQAFAEQIKAERTGEHQHLREDGDRDSRQDEAGLPV